MEIIATGECMVEFFCEGKFSSAEIFRRAYGGDTLNTLVAASRLGSSTGYITKVGNDAFADFLLSSWKKEGIDVSHCTLTDGFNGIYFISIDGKDREFTYHRRGSAASRLDAGEMDSAFISSTRILFSSGITQAISENNCKYVGALFKIGSEKGVKVAFDLNFREKLWSTEAALAAFKEVAGYIDILFLNSQEAKLFSGYEDPEDAAGHFLSRGIETVVIKLGGDGCFVARGGKTEVIPPVKVKAIDTTGAGDAFNGGFLHGIAKGFDPFASAKIGNAVAGLKVRGRGAVLSLPTRAEVERYLGFKLSRCC